MAKTVLDYKPSSTNTTTSNALHAHGARNYQIVNETGQSINYTLEGTYAGDESNFDDAVTIASGSVSANSTTNITHSAAWDRVRIKATPSTAPNGSNQFLVTQHEPNV